MLIFDVAGQIPLFKRIVEQVEQEFSVLSLVYEPQILVASRSDALAPSDSQMLEEILVEPFISGKIEFSVEKGDQAHSLSRIRNRYAVVFWSGLLLVCLLQFSRNLVTLRTWGFVLPASSVTSSARLGFTGR